VTLMMINTHATMTRRRHALAATFAGLLLFIQGSAIASAQTEKAAKTEPLPTGPYRIAGTVVSSQDGSPVAEARIQIMDTSNRQRLRALVTSEDGGFEFRVIAGKFALQGAKRGYITASYNQHEQFSTAIVTGASFDTEHLVLRLPPVAVLEGKVLDEAGEPVRGALVQIYREDRGSGVSRILPFSNATTGDQGAYEAASLDAGTYFVSVHAAPWYAVHPLTGREPSPVNRSLDVAYPITYYGDTTEADDATPIPVSGGDHLEADIHLTPAPALHLIFHADENAQSAQAPMLQVPAFDGVEQIQTQGAQTISPGVFEVNGIAAGKYLVRMPDSSGGFKAPAEMDLSNSQELDSTSARSASNIKAAVQIRGTAKLPEELHVALRSSQGRFVAWELVNPNGEVDFQDATPGNYEVLAGTPTKAYSVVGITTDKGKTRGHSLNVPAGASLAVSLALVEGKVSVEGFAKRAGKPASGVMIVLVPRDPETNQELFRRDQSDLDGSFTLHSVVPGSYTLIAIDDGWDLDWAKPTVLAPYLKHGQPIKVEDQARGAVHIPGSIEVQKR
jgi:5-hydroxyisourate hydrolase-like protein (transthyretin family)